MKLIKYFLIIMIFSFSVSYADNDINFQKWKINFENIDLVVVNFYPFEETLNNTKNHKKIIENIDVGGPTMVRSAAKNYQDVTVITSSNQYEELIEEVKKK